MGYTISIMSFMIYEAKWLYWKPNYPAVKGDLRKGRKRFQFLGDVFFY